MLASRQTIKRLKFTQNYKGRLDPRPDSNLIVRNEGNPRDWVCSIMYYQADDKGLDPIRDKL